MVVDLKKLFVKVVDINEKVSIKLLAAIKNNAIAEMDYLKFKKSYQSLCEMGMDEATAAKSSFLTASTMGFTKNNLITSAKFYKNILFKEKQDFALALKNQITSNVETRQLEIQKLKEKKSDYIKKIAQMQAELSTFDERIDKVENEVELASQKIEDTRNQFVQTVSVFEKEIDEDIEMFERILD